MLEDRRLFLSVSVEDEARSLKDSVPILLTPPARAKGLTRNRTEKNERRRVEEGELKSIS